MQPHRGEEDTVRVPDHVDELGGTVGDAMLAVHKSYLPIIRALRDQQGVHGFSHITGGGISENIVRVIPKELGLEIDLSSWKFPAVFDWLQSRGAIQEQEMLRTFNCGIGMMILAAENDADEICEALNKVGEPVHRIGRVTETGDTSQRVQYIRS